MLSKVPVATKKNVLEAILLKNGMSGLVIDRFDKFLLDQLIRIEHAVAVAVDELAYLPHIAIKRLHPSGKSKSVLVVPSVEHLDTFELLGDALRSVPKLSSQDGVGFGRVKRPEIKRSKICADDRLDRLRVGLDKFRVKSQNISNEAGRVR